MRRIISLVIALALIMTSAGCETVRKKFRRKKKETIQMPRVHPIKEYKKLPSPDLYRKHYAYWVSWQSEILKVLGQSRKKDMRCMEEIIGNLKDMQNILIPEKGAQMQKHIDRLDVVRGTIANGDLTQYNKDYVRMTLDREDRAIKREFSFQKVKGYFKESFDDVPQQ